MSAERPNVLIVEDERELADLYGEWLEMAGCSVRTAYDGRAALEYLDSEVDVVLLDRRLPEIRGKQVLERIRDSERDCSVAMVTAVEPDFDVITMGFDDYLIKPVEQGTLLETIERLLSRSAYAELEQELYALVSKQAVIESSKSEEELTDNEEFVELESRIAALRAELDDTLSEIENDEFVAMVRDLESEAGRTGADDDDERSGETEGGE